MPTERDNILPADQLPGHTPEGVTERAPEPYPTKREPVPVRRLWLGRLLSMLFVTVIGVVAVGLALPVCQELHGRAAQVHCHNNLLHLSFAIHSYADTHNNRLPPQSHENPDIGPASFFFTILPYVEGDITFDRARGAGACWNAGISSTVLRPYLCPSDTSHSNGLAPNGWAVTSYSTNTLLFASRVTTVPVSCHAKYNLNGIPDGTSNTIALVERYGVNPTSGYTSLWAAPCGGAWGWPDTAHAYGMWSTGLPEFDVTPAHARYDVPSSGHKVVQVALLDGSVRSVTVKVGATTWRRLLTPDDGSPLGRDWE